MKQLVTVTGGNGMLGSHVIRELLQRNYRVRALVQPGTSVVSLQDLPVEIIDADITKTAQVMHAVRGSTYLIHTAASTAIWPPRSVDVFNVNLQGTANIVLAARELGIQRLVHVSSANVFASGTRECPGDESGAFNGFTFGLDYIDSKYQAHQLVQKAAAMGLDCVIVNPTFMLGAFDSGNGSGKLVLAVKSGSLKAIPPGGRNFICARDAATAIVNALTMGRKGQSYILANENLSYAQVLPLIAQVVNGRKPSWRLPSYLVKTIGDVNTWLAAILGTRPLMSKQVARMACAQQYYTASKAIQELRLPQTPVSEGIREAWQWFQQQGIR